MAAQTIVAVGKVGLASFADANRLTAIGNNMFRRKWARSGAGESWAKAVQDGRGKIHSGALEMSNIDMTGELSQVDSRATGLFRNITSASIRNRNGA